MKFHQLPPGARFRYRDQVYHKISPLRGARDDGGQHLIARSADVEPLDADAGAMPNTPPQTLAWRTVDRALVDFVAACDRATKRTDPPLDPAQRAQLLQAIHDARQDMLNRLATRR